MFNNLLTSFFGERFCRESKVSAASTSKTQEAAPMTSQDSQLEKEIAALVQYYGIKKGESQQITTTLSEIEGVVYRQRRRSDAYAKILSEVFTRTGTKIEIVSRKSNS